jgi:hypothetical protein
LGCHGLETEWCLSVMLIAFVGVAFERYGDGFGTGMLPSKHARRTTWCEVKIQDYLCLSSIVCTL